MLSPALQLVPAPAKSRVWLVVLTIGVPTLATVIGTASGRFPTAASLWGTGHAGADTLIAAAVVLLVTATIAALLVLALRRHRLEPTADGFDIVTTFYRQHVRLPELRLGEARVVRLDERPDLKPLLKTNGYALPGFRSGWFRLRGWQRAFVAMADGRQLLWLPTNASYGLLLQPRQPQALLDALRDRAGAAAPR